MTQGEIIQYNKMCAEFLKARKFIVEDLEGNDVTNEYELYGIIEAINDGENEKHFFEPKDMLFDSDWNWIMEVVGEIQLLDVVHDNTRSYDAVFREWQCTFSPAYKTHDFGYIVGRSKTSEKEAVIQANNQFLIWYKENKTI